MNHDVRARKPRRRPSSEREVPWGPLIVAIAALHLLTWWAGSSFVWSALAPRWWLWVLMTLGFLPGLTLRWLEYRPHRGVAVGPLILTVICLGGVVANWVVRRPMALVPGYNPLLPVGALVALYGWVFILPAAAGMALGALFATDESPHS